MTPTRTPSPTTLTSNRSRSLSVATASQPLVPNDSVLDLFANTNTPQRLKLALGLICCSALLSALSIMAATDSQQRAFKTLQKDTTPSIVTAQRIKDSLADLDANVANSLIQGILTPTANKNALIQEEAGNGASLLVPDPDMKPLNPNSNEPLNPDDINLIIGDPATAQPLLDPKTGKILSDGFEYRQNRLSGWLIKASKNITYPGEWEPIWQIQYGFGNYLELAQRARDLQAQGDRDGMLRTYRQAIELMDKRLLPAADRLTEVNHEKLKTQYEQQRSHAFQNGLLVFLFGGLLTGSLIGLQHFLRQHTHRQLNLCLLAATALSAGSTLYTISVLNNSDLALKVAGQDAFASIYALREVRTLAYMANASESRYLLDRASASQHEKDFNDRIHKIFHLKSGDSFNPQQFRGKEKIPPEVAEGLLVNALNNITFAGEAEVLNELLLELNAYIAVDQTIRQLANSGRLNDAIALCVGYEPGQSNAIFSQVLAANRSAAALNQKAFDKAIVEGTDMVASSPILGLRRTIIVFGLVGILSCLGVYPRLREYAK